MCVRYSLHELNAAILAVARALGVNLEAEPAAPRYNVAPSQLAPVVTRESGLVRLRSLRWGFLSAGAPGEKRRLLANARSETAARLPTFRAAARHRRCLVPVNGFYEFKDLGRAKEPYFISARDGTAFALAGLWEPPPEEEAAEFCVLTTEPNATMRAIHNRMPVILTGDAMGRWLGEEPLPETELAELIQPAPADLLAARRVNSYVNNSRHEGPKCLAEPDPPEPELF